MRIDACMTIGVSEFAVYTYVDNITDNDYSSDVNMSMHALNV